MRDVTPADCDDAELLFMMPLSLDGIGLTASFADRADMLRPPRIAIVFAGGYDRTVVHQYRRRTPPVSRNAD